MQQPSKFTPIIISTSIIVVISLFPIVNLINLLCCGGVLIGVFAGTAYYNSKLKQAGQIIQYKDGAAIGLLSGIVSALFIVAGTTLMNMIVNQNPIPELFKLIDSNGLSLPPEAEKFLQKISDEYSKKGFSITMTLITLISDILIYPLFGMLGGLLSVSILSKRNEAR
jgi:spore germination protein GerM